jgi:hypothetical protein
VSAAAWPATGGRTWLQNHPASGLELRQAGDWYLAGKPGDPETFARGGCIA